MAPPTIEVAFAHKVSPFFLVEGAQVPSLILCPSCGQKKTPLIVALFPGLRPPTSIAQVFICVTSIPFLRLSSSLSIFFFFDIIASFHSSCRRWPSIRKRPVPYLFDLHEQVDLPAFNFFVFLGWSSPSPGHRSTPPSYPSSKRPSFFFCTIVVRAQTPLPSSMGL